eukprot:g6278.t1
MNFRSRRSIKFAADSQIGLVCSRNEVVNVVVGSQAEKAGVQKGWYLVSLNNERAPSDDVEIVKLLRRLCKSSKTIKIVFSAPPGISMGVNESDEMEQMKKRFKKDRFEPLPGVDGPPIVMYYTAEEQKKSAKAARKRKMSRAKNAAEEVQNAKLAASSALAKRKKASEAKQWFHRAHDIDNKEFSPRERERRAAMEMSKKKYDEKNVSEIDHMKKQFVERGSTLLSSNRKRIDAAIAHKRLKVDLESQKVINSSDPSIRKTEAALNLRKREQHKWDESMESELSAQRQEIRLIVNQRVTTRQRSIGEGGLRNFEKNLANRKDPTTDNSKNLSFSVPNVDEENDGRPQWLEDQSNGIRPITNSITKWPSKYTPPSSSRGRGHNNRRNFKSIGAKTETIAFLDRNGPMKEWLDKYEKEKKEEKWYGWMDGWEEGVAEHNSLELFLSIKLVELQQLSISNIQTRTKPSKLLTAGVLQLLSAGANRLCGNVGIKRGTGVSVFALALAEIYPAVFGGLRHGPERDEITDYHYGGDESLLSEGKGVEGRKMIEGGEEEEMDKGKSESWEKDKVEFARRAYAAGAREVMEKTEQPIGTSIRDALSSLPNGQKMQAKSLLTRPQVFTALRSGFQATLDEKKAFWKGNLKIEGRQQLCRALAQALSSIDSSTIQQQQQRQQHFKSPPSSPMNNRKRKKNNRKKKTPIQMMNSIDPKNKWGDEIFCGKDPIIRWKYMYDYIPKFDEVTRLQNELQKEEETRVLLQHRLKRRAKVQIIERRGINRLATNNMRAATCFWFVCWKKWFITRRGKEEMSDYFYERQRHSRMKKMFEAILHYLRVKNCSNALTYQNRLIAQKDIERKRITRFEKLAKESQKKIDGMIDERDRLRKALEEALEILNRPERQPKRLGANLAGLCDATVPLIRSLQFESHLRIKEMRRKGAGTERFAPLYRYRRNSGELLNDSEDEESESDYDEEVEETIKQWRPGLPAAKKAMKEITPAFRPFSTRPGRRLVRWVNYHLWNSGIELGKKVKNPSDLAKQYNVDESTDIFKKLVPGQRTAVPLSEKNDGLKGGGNLLDGQALSVIVQRVLSAVEMRKEHRAKNEEHRLREKRIREARERFDKEQDVRRMRRKQMWSQLAGDTNSSKSKFQRQKYDWEINGSERHEHSALLLQKIYRGKLGLMKVNVIRQKALRDNDIEYQLRCAFSPLERLKKCRDELRDKVQCMRFIDNMRRLTGEEEPPTPEQEAAMAKRLERLAKRELETGIVVHIMSKYMGMRVHIEMDQEPHWFCVFAQLFFLHSGIEMFEDPVAKKCMNATIRQFKTVHEIFTTFWSGNYSDVYPKHFHHYNWATGETKLPVSLSHEELINLTKNFKKEYSSFIKNTARLADRFAYCIADRLQYEKSRTNMMRLGWQSLCTTVLSRRTRREEDLDDGTYTTIDPVQMGNVFKRLEVEDEEERIAECAACKKILVKRIRDLKRIFAYYCASGDDGDATTMDSSEYWKFVKECKLQADRKRMPSVRVDIIFQQADQDFRKTGRERLESATGEFEAPKWIEALARLASYRFKKGTLSERLEKMLNEWVLPNACSIDLDVFRDRVNSDQVQEVLNKHRRYNKPIFDVYAADDDSDAAIDCLGTMNVKEMVTFCSEMELIGSRFGQRSCRILFAYCQQEEEELDDDEDDSGDSEMVFSEFCETLIAIACYMRCNPYVVVEIRLKNFLNEQLYPAAVKLDRFRKILKWKPPAKKVKKNK